MLDKSDNINALLKKYFDAERYTIEPSFTYGRDINSILYDIMDVEEISKINISPESLKSIQE